MDIPQRPSIAQVRRRTTPRPSDLVTLQTGIRRYPSSRELRGCPINTSILSTHNRNKLSPTVTHSTMPLSHSGVLPKDTRAITAMMVVGLCCNPAFRRLAGTSICIPIHPRKTISQCVCHASHLYGRMMHKTCTSPLYFYCCNCSLPTPVYLVLSLMLSVSPHSVSPLRFLTCLLSRSALCFFWDCFLSMYSTSFSLDIHMVVAPVRFVNEDYYYLP